jgi:hypothetical protein
MGPTYLVLKKGHHQELPDPSLPKNICLHPCSGHGVCKSSKQGGVEGRPTRKPDRCCRSRTPTAATTTSSCSRSWPRRRRRRWHMLRESWITTVGVGSFSSSSPAIFRIYLSLYLPFPRAPSLSQVVSPHQIRCTAVSSTRSTNWITTVRL